MLELQLFRIRVYPPLQGDLFVTEKSRPQMLREVIESLPKGEFRRGLIWHIGNVTPIDADGLYFRLGRTTTSTLEFYNEDEGAFADQEFETAPYTHAVVDVELEICAIAKRARLAPTIPGIARQFARLLNESPKAAEFEATFEIDEVKDPDDFIAHLRDAFAISKFRVWFARPNAFDADTDFVKPFQRMVEASNGEKGKAEFKGENLNAETLEAVTRSAAATGDDAEAWIKSRQESRLMKKRLRGSSVGTMHEHLDSNAEKRGLLGKLRQLYHKVRGDSGDIR